MITAARRQLPVIFGVGVLIAALVAYFLVHPRGISPYVVQSFLNTSAALALAAIGQTFPVLTGGLDLSLGGIVALTNVIASSLMEGSPMQIAMGIGLVLISGCLCGAINGVVIVFGRIQPIIATLATGAIFAGLALFIRPRPGGAIDEDLADLFTAQVLGGVPLGTLAVCAAGGVAWYFVKHTITGRGIFAAGSSPQAAALSGLKLWRSIIAAYTLSGFFAALAGLFLSFQTLSGDATIGIPYTINSIAAVVIGGLSLRGGSGSILSGIVGAHTLRSISAILLFTGAPPLAQPFFEGAVLVLAVVVASLGTISNPDRLRMFR